MHKILIIDKTPPPIGPVTMHIDSFKNFTIKIVNSIYLCLISKNKVILMCKFMTFSPIDSR